jgi:hypothetical protein
LAAVTVAAVGDGARAQDPLSLQQQATAHLRAGEFGPAIALANQAADPALRDRLLAAVARSQAAAGARPAAIDTLSSISDGQLLDAAVQSVAAEPFTAGPRFGGGTQADFTQLIDLITRTVAPTTWDAVGGPGAISEFPGGVYVDAQGVLNRLPRDQTGGGLDILRLHATRPGADQDLTRPSQLRKVSLTRLERQLQLSWAQGRAPTQAMRFLAGLQRVRYVFVYPDSGELVIAGPAGAWTEDGEGRVVSRDSGVPVLQLDDLVVLLRNTWDNGGRYSCSINPRQANLAATKQFLESLPQRSLRPEEGAATRAKLRETLGQQDIEVKGIDPRTRAAQVIVEADYRMKLVGMGLEDGVLGVESYLDSIEIGPGAGPPPTSILRWWFAMEYQPLRTTPERNAFQLQGQGAKVLSENAMITETGERVFVGNTDPLTEQFASSFTKHFAELATKYPVYADLRNVFDLSLVAALMVAEDLPGRIGWQMPFFRDDQRCTVHLGHAPTAVETVIHHRKIRQGRTQHIVTGVSGGVTADPNPFVRSDAIVVDGYGTLEAELGGAAPPPQDAAWWWD